MPCSGCSSLCEVKPNQRKKRRKNGLRSCRFLLLPGIKGLKYFMRYFLRIMLLGIIHPLNTYAKISEKLIFLTPWYAHAHLHIKFYYEMLAILTYLLNAWATAYYFFLFKQNLIHLPFYWPIQDYYLFTNLSILVDIFAYLFI